MGQLSSLHSFLVKLRQLVQIWFDLAIVLYSKFWLEWNLYIFAMIFGMQVKHIFPKIANHFKTTVIICTKFLLDLPVSFMRINILKKSYTNWANL